MTIKSDVTINATLAAIGQKATVGGASATGAAWYLSNEALGVIGALVAVVGLLVNIYYRRKENARRQALHEATLQALQLSGAIGLAAAIAAAPNHE